MPGARSLTRRYEKHGASYTSFRIRLWHGPSEERVHDYGQWRACGGVPVPQVKAVARACGLRHVVDQVEVLSPRPCRRHFRYGPVFVDVALS